MVEKKVIPFQRSNTTPQLTSSEARQLGDDCRKMTLAFLKDLLQKMFDTADDTLFNLAETSGNDTDQGLYFDSMRIIRFKRDLIEESFFNEVSDVFRDFWISTPHDESGEFVIPDELKLVEDQDLEEELAVKNLIRKIQSNFQQDISAIEKRLSEIVSNKEINTHNNPTGPVTFCKAFQFAASELNADIKIKIILFKLFDFHINASIGALYQKINEYFIEAGVLPQLKLTINKSSTNSPSTQQANTQEVVSTLQGNGASQGPSEIGTLSAFQQLLHAPSQLYGSQANTNQADPLTAYRNASSQMNILTSDVLVSNLTPLQSQAQENFTSDSVGAISQQIKQNILASHPSQQINPLDNDIIDLVSMLFEFVLEDQHIPVTARSCIARLQIPIIKTAILDKEFFNINGHPARKLLNTLAHAGLDLPTDGVDDTHPVLVAIQYAVDRILNEFNNDLTIFEQVLSELEQSLETYEYNKSKLADESLQPFYKKEQYRLAEQWVTETIQSQIENKALPEPFTSLLLGAWKNVMIETYLDEGQKSIRWKNQQRFVDILCWSVEPKFITQDRKKLGNILRFIIGTLNEGLTQIKTPAQTIDKITQALEPYHYASLFGKSLQNDENHVDGVFETDIHKDSLSSTIDKLQIAIDELPEIENEYCGHGDKHILENIVLEGYDPEEAMQEYPDDEYLNLARHLEAGKWVEFTNENHKKARARLAWKSELLGEFTFLNWKFDVIADKNLFELANDFRQGNAKIINDLPLIDRAFSAIMNTLERKTGTD